MIDPAHPVAAVRRRFVLAAVLLGAAGCAAKPPVDAPPASVIFFTAQSADLDQGAKQVIDDVAKDALANPRRMVIVEGYADQIGSSAANQTLSKLRAQVVADALATKGVNPAKIVIRPRGPTSADLGLESRRVEVSFSR